MTIENTMIVESNFVELLKDAVDLYECCGGTLEDAFEQCANEIYKDNSKNKILANSIKRTVINLKKN